MTRLSWYTRVVALIAVILSGTCLATEYPTPLDCPDFAQPRFTSVPLDVAFPGVEYNIRPAVKGGTYPYLFALSKSPEGMKIDGRTGTIVWTPAAREQPVEIEILATDMAGRTCKQAFTLRVTRELFFHVSPGGDDSADGSLEKPWKTIERAIMPPANFTYPKGAVLYIHGGAYTVNVPATPGKTNANIIDVNGRSPKRWIAWPGDKPVIDLGWSPEQQQAAHDKQRASGKPEGDNKEIGTHNYGHRIRLVGGSDHLYIDGLEVKNTCYYTFQMWEGRNTLHIRRSNLHHMYGDYRENPSFIFAGAGDRRGDINAWGVRPDCDYYRNFVIQDNWMHDRPYIAYRSDGGHGGGMVFYTVRDAVVEDNLIENIQRGECICDKDNGLGNTYRNNVLRGSSSLLGQWCNDETEICNNYIEGSLRIGLQPGWVRNIWVHHNTIRGHVQLMGGATAVPDVLDAASGDLTSPTTEDARRAVKAFPAARRLVHFYRNILLSPGAADKNVVLQMSKGKFFADKFRYVRWDENLVDPAGQVDILWNRMTDWSLMKEAGLDVNGIQAPVTVDPDGCLPAGSPYAGRFGRQPSPRPLNLGLSPRTASGLP